MKVGHATKRDNVILCIVSTKILESVRPGWEIALLATQQGLNINTCVFSEFPCDKNAEDDKAYDSDFAIVICCKQSSTQKYFKKYIQDMYNMYERNMFDFVNTVLLSVYGAESVKPISSNDFHVYAFETDLAEIKRLKLITDLLSH